MAFTALRFPSGKGLKFVWCVLVVGVLYHVYYFISPTVGIDINCGKECSELENKTEPEVCLPVKRVAFLKVHKAGSSTAANIFQRFGFDRNLNFVIPRKRLHAFGYNYIGQTGDTISRSNIMPLPDGQSYDVLWNHVVYNRTAFKAILPNDTAYVTIIREPFEQFVSAFEYFGMHGTNYLQRISRGNRTNPLSEYLKDPARFEPPNVLMSHVRNKQAFDLGMTRSEILNPVLRAHYLKQLRDDFKVVMIMEQFDESVILLRRKFCWSHKNVLYFRKNVNPYRRRRLFDVIDYERHKNISQADYAIYDYFHKIFWKNIWAEGEDFFQEVKYFKSLLKKTLDHCLRGKPLRVDANVWSASFVVGKEDCHLMSLTELQFLDKIFNNSVDKMFRHYIRKHDGQFHNVVI